MFEKIIFSGIYNFLLEDLLNPNPSGFRPSESCINQLLAIIHEIFEAFDCNPPLEIRSVLLDISKAFDKVCTKGCFISLSQWVFQEISLIFLKIIYQIDFKELL